MHNLVRYTILTLTHNLVASRHIFKLIWNNVLYRRIANDDIIFFVSILFNTTLLWWNRCYFMEFSYWHFQPKLRNDLFFSFTINRHLQEVIFYSWLHNNLCMMYYPIIQIFINFILIFYALYALEYSIKHVACSSCLEFCFIST